MAFTYQDKQTLNVIGVVEILLSILAIIVGVSEEAILSLNQVYYGSINAYAFIGTIYGFLQLAMASFTVFTTRAGRQTRVKICGILNKLGVVSSLALVVTSSISLKSASAHPCQEARYSLMKMNCENLDVIVVLDCLLTTIGLLELALAFACSFICHTVCVCCQSTGQIAVPNSAVSPQRDTKTDHNILLGLAFIEFFLSLVILSLGIVSITGNGSPYSINGEFGTGIAFGCSFFFLSITSFAACLPQKKHWVLFFLISNGLGLFIGVFMVVSSIVSLSFPLRNGFKLIPYDAYTTTTPSSTSYDWRKQYETSTRDNTKYNNDLALAMDVSLTITGFLAIFIISESIYIFSKLYFLENKPPSQVETVAASALPEPLTVTYISTAPEIDTTVSGARAREPAVAFPRSMRLHDEAPPYEEPGPEYKPPAVDDSLPSYDSLQIKKS
ncbi:uncharacterized protein [Watersipora subatra]|uniref:uncharacterized protein isoform X2 n=1 Tax=Watersipora subatra TaxID=2589382 RepID=UPI00355B6945